MLHVVLTTVPASSFRITRGNRSISSRLQQTNHPARACGKRVNFSTLWSNLPQLGPTNYRDWSRTDRQSRSRRSIRLHRSVICTRRDSVFDWWPINWCLQTFVNIESWNAFLRGFVFYRFSFPFFWSTISLSLPLAVSVFARFGRNFKWAQTVAEAG